MAMAPSLLPVTAQSLFTLPLQEVRSHLLSLFCQGAYQEGDFVLSSGQHSTYYINGKLVTLHPQGAILVGRLLLDLLGPDVQAVAGLTLGADPIVTAVSLVGINQGKVLFPLIVRKEAKGHGTQAYIEGVSLEPGAPVAVLEDVVTTGQSALKAVDRLQSAGYRVNQILALVDRQQGGAKLYKEKGLTFKSVFTIKDIQTYWANRSPQ